MSEGPLFDADADPVERSRDLGRQLLAIPADRVFTKRAVVAGFAVVMAAFGVVLAVLLDFTSDTRNAVESEIPALQDQVDDRNADLAETEDLLRQATDAIVLLLDLLDANGIDAPPIRIEPTTTTTEEQKP